MNRNLVTFEEWLITAERSMRPVRSRFKILSPVTKSSVKLASSATKDLLVGATTGAVAARIAVAINGQYQWQQLQSATQVATNAQQNECRAHREYTVRMEAVRASNHCSHIPADLVSLSAMET